MIEKLEKYVELVIDKLGDNKKVVTIGLVIVGALVLLQLMGG